LRNKQFFLDIRRPIVYTYNCSEEAARLFGYTPAPFFSKPAVENRRFSMKRSIIHSGFLAESPVEYRGEYIYKVVGLKEQRGFRYYLLEHDAWVKMIGQEKYIAERMQDEIWGRVEELEVDDETGKTIYSRDLGFVRIDLDKKVR